MARRKKSFGSPSKVHLRAAVGSRQAYRLERKVILQHLAAGECGAAVRGLVMAGYVFGAAQAHKDSLSTRRASKGRYRYGKAPASDLNRLAWKITDKCKI